MYKIVFLDIDGTLVNHEKKVSEGTKQAIKQLKQNGIEVALATGRPPYHFTEIAEEIGLNSFVSLNGAYACYQGKVIPQKSEISKDLLEKLMKHSSELGHPLTFSSHLKTVSNHKDHPEIIKSFQDLKLDYCPEYQPQFWKEEVIYQAMVYCKQHEEGYYHEMIPELTFTRWHHLSMDVMSADVSKASGIKAMLEYLGFSAKEAVAFGDGLNDKEMLTFVGMGVAMGNAHDEIKPYANMVTKSNEEDGIVHALYELGLLTKNCTRSS
ncbi:MAG TPA: Cof-type HAD-IIB family hydrolase [Bacillus sp. (in: firmicutes)]|uniref:Cof-type HAD-IIB family hydrolase n=1 Tax=Bacillus litorisediminis TaxID=2922713 RepID=UPI001FAFED2F|nr:Cof-type HAD-IIB family hydrolase [Bacillus litorisediminis]HWO74335.1 Cof-type HAD-IIB family hydrolase [Bacillus sp. (in: firmicutes)]